MDRENIGATVGLMLAVWTAAVAGGAFAGVLDKLAPEELAALCAFTTAFALGAFALDREVGAFIRARTTPIAVLVLDGLVALDVLAAARTPHGLDALAAVPYSAGLLFLLPLAAVATAAMPSRAKRASAIVRSAPAR